MKPTVIITGSKGGIGEALCRAFDEHGYYVIGCDITDAQKISGTFLQLDLREFVDSKEYRQQKLTELHSLLPSGRLSCLINNAGVQNLGDTSIIEASAWQESINVNLTAPFYLVQGLLPALSKERGSVINIGSIHSRLTKPGFVSYATSKAGLDGLTRALAVDLGGRIRVNSIAPAATETPMLLAGFKENPELQKQLSSYHPVGRIAQAAEIAELALFLASSKASFITGEIVSIDGGIGSRLHDPE